MNNITINQFAYNKLILDSIERYPIEACGILSGATIVIKNAYPITNSLNSSTAFLMDPREEVNTLQQLEELGEEFLGIYHSHPHGLAEPSLTDINNNLLEAAIHLILSRKNKEWQAKAYLYNPDGIQELNLNIEDN